MRVEQRGGLARARYAGLLRDVMHNVESTLDLSKRSRPKFGSSLSGSVGKRTASPGTDFGQLVQNGTVAPRQMMTGIDS